MYIGTPEGQRPRIDKRRSDPEEMDEDVNKVRKFNLDTEEGESMLVESESPDKEPVTKIQKLDDDMLDSMNEVDRKILAAAILGVDITEVYSPERVAKVARRFGLRAGSSFDLTNGWDFNLEDHRKKAWTKIKEESPYLLVGSPPCTYASMLQELNVAVHGHKPEWMAKFDEEKRKAKIHVAFCCTLYQEQLRQGRHFLHEHPWSARSWGLPCIQQLMSHPGVELVQGHMCRFRMTTHIETKDGARGLVKKPTGFLSSSRCVRQQLNRKCTGDHSHVPLVGGRAAGAQVYPQMLCEAICRGVANQQREDAAMGVSTGRMTTEEVKSFAHHICNLNQGRKSGIQKISSVNESEDGTTPIGQYPEHWVDTWHELEGGSDQFGLRLSLV